MSGKPIASHASPQQTEREQTDARCCKVTDRYTFSAGEACDGRTDPIAYHRRGLRVVLACRLQAHQRRRHFGTGGRDQAYALCAFSQQGRSARGRAGPLQRARPGSARAHRQPDARRSGRNDHIVLRPAGRMGKRDAALVRVGIDPAGRRARRPAWTPCARHCTPREGDDGSLAERAAGIEDASRGRASAPARSCC